MHTVTVLLLCPCGKRDDGASTSLKTTAFSRGEGGRTGPKSAFEKSLGFGTVVGISRIYMKESLYS